MLPAFFLYGTLPVRTKPQKGRGPREASNLHQCGVRGRGEENPTANVQPLPVGAFRHARDLVKAPPSIPVSR
jgi:hypothetical protein